MAAPSLPQCCSNEAFKMLSRQMDTLSSTDALLYGAVAISRHKLEDADLGTVDRQLQRLADAVRKRTRSTQVQAVVAHLHEVLFEQEGFKGNTEDYYNPLNSFLPAVLETRRGLPITLSLVYKVVAERLGLRCYGVGLPGHFLVAVEESEDTRLLVDTFAGGRALTSDEARQRVEELFGPDADWSEEMLQPASNRHWLTRILQNLLHIYGTSNQFSDVAAVLEMEMLLWPQQHQLQRDLALVLARIGLSRPASIWLDSYLQTNPDDPQQTDLRQLLAALSA